MKHFENHKGYSSCNPAKKYEQSTNWQKVSCKKCKKTAQFIQAKNDSPATRPVKEKIIISVQSQGQWDIVTEFHNIKWARGKWNTYGTYTVIAPFDKCATSEGAYGTINSYSESFRILSFQEWDSKYRQNRFPEVTLSGCDRTKAEFFKAVKIEDNRSWNVELFDNREWRGMYYAKDINNIQRLDGFIEDMGLDNFRIKKEDKILGSPLIGLWADEAKYLAKNFYKSNPQTLSFDHSGNNNHAVKKYFSVCGKGINEFSNQCKDNCSNVWNKILGKKAGYDKETLIAIFKEEPSQIEYYEITEPVTYIVTEEQMDILLGHTARAIECKVAYNENHENMKNEAFTVKEKALCQIFSALNDIKEVKS